MTQMPNWFRWLIIVIATLIMCACRAPMQNGQANPQSVLFNPQTSTRPTTNGVPSDLLYNQGGQQNVGGQQDASAHHQMTKVSPGFSGSATQTGGASQPERKVALELAALAEPRARGRNTAKALKANPNTAHARRAKQQASIIELLKGEPETKQTTITAIRPPIAVAQRSTQTPIAAQMRRGTQSFAPVVKHTDAGVRIQDIQSTLAVAAATNIASDLAKSAPADSASRAVYLRMNDEVTSTELGQSDKVVAAGAQLDAEVGSHLGSQFGTTDAITPSETPLAPIVSAPIISSEFANGQTIQPTPANAGSVLMPNTSHPGEVVPNAGLPHVVMPNAVVPSDTGWVGAPIVDSPNHMMSGQPTSPVPYSQPANGQPVYETPVYGPPSYEQPLLAEDAVLSLDEPPQSYASGPYEEYLPVEEVPVEVQPEHWADDPYAAGQNIAERELSRRYPDEYICDGGDANGQVFVMNDWRLRNLDPEDTIGHYDTKAGEVVVEASNRVCVYAPRFAAARQVTSPFQNEKHEQLLVAASGTKAFLEQLDSSTNQLDTTLSPQRHVLMQPASSFRQKTAGVEGIQRRAVKIAAYDVSAHEDFRVIKLGIHKQSEKARLAEFTAKAVNWTSDKAVQILVDEEVAKTNVSRRGAETFFTVGDNGPAKLRVIKTASRADALPGEEVEFTLRFDNVGYQTIGNVTVVDNLTTRLEFIEDSDLCSEECTFLTDDNDAESLRLRWEIKDPIKPGKGGLIRFRCRVR